MTLAAIIKIRRANRRYRNTAQKVRPMDWTPYRQDAGVTPCAAWETPEPLRMGPGMRAAYRGESHQGYWREAAREVYLQYVAKVPE